MPRSLILGFSKSWIFNQLAPLKRIIRNICLTAAQRPFNTTHISSADVARSFTSFMRLKEVLVEVKSCLSAYLFIYAGDHLSGYILRAYCA